MDETETMPGTDLEVVGPAEEFEIAESVFTEERRLQIAAYWGLDKNLAAFPAFFAFCARYKLPAINGGVWLIERKDGTHGVYAGRDAYLTIANRQPDFVGLQSDVVREGDDYSMEWIDGGPDGTMIPKVRHAHGKAKERGGVLGAWAILSRRGRAPLFFYGPASEYVKTYDDGNLKGAWKQLSAMMTKAVQSNVLRVGYSLAGAIPLDELRGADPNEAAGIRETPEGGRVREVEESVEDVLNAVWAESDEDLGEELRARLDSAIARANEDEPGSWPPAKVQMTFSKRSRSAVEGLVGELEERYPPDAETVDDDAGDAIADDDAPEPESVTPEEEVLRARVRDLELRRDAATDEQREEIDAELDQAEGRLRELAAENPEQEAMEV